MRGEAEFGLREGGGGGDRGFRQVERRGKKEKE